MSMIKDDSNMEFKGNRVKHKTLGEGTIVSSDLKYIIVVFDNDTEKPSRKLSIAGIGNGLLKVITESPELMESFETKIENAKTLKNYSELIRRLKYYGFEGFVHYTAYNNLKSIIDSGYIYSRDEMLKNGIEWIDVAEESVLRETPEEIKNKVRLLYGFNTPISYWFEKKAIEKNTEMVAIVLDPRIILEQQVYFYEKSAARASYGTPSDDIEIIERFNWKEIFERGSLPPDEEVKYNKKKYRDAEAVVEGSVSTEYITDIYFRSKEFLNRAKKEIGGKDIFRKGRIGEDKHFTSGV